MEKAFRALIDKHVPYPNRAVCDGLATTYIPLAEAYIDEVFKSAIRSLPNLKYLGPKPCTPKEEYEEVTRPRNGRRTFNLARSDIYQVRYWFEYQGVKFDRYLYLPFVEDAGIIHLSGSCYHIHPVLTDKCVSATNQGVFVRLERDKVNFYRLPYSYMTNQGREQTYVVWSEIFRKSKEMQKVPATTRAKSCIAHYLFARYGFMETFARFANTVPIVGELTEHMEQDFPSSEWVVSYSVQIKPKSYMEQVYFPSRLFVAVKRTDWNSITQALVAGCFYVIDHFPQRISVETIVDARLWVILLGEVIFSGNSRVGVNCTRIQEHFNSLDEYVDPIVARKLIEIGCEVQDFYELMAFILKEFNQWTLASPEVTQSVYGKNLEVLYYALFDIKASIFRTVFQLVKQDRKKQEKGSMLSAKDVQDIFNKHLKPGSIFGLQRANIAAGSVSYSGDNKYFKLTSVIGQQQSVVGARRGRRTRTIVDASKRLHSSMIEAGSVLFLSKSNPTPMIRANPYLHLDLSTGIITPNPKFQALLEHTESLLKANKETQ